MKAKLFITLALILMLNFSSKAKEGEIINKNDRLELIKRLNKFLEERKNLVDESGHKKFLSETTFPFKFELENADGEAAEDKKGDNVDLKKDKSMIPYESKLLMKVGSALKAKARLAKNLRSLIMPENETFALGESLRVSYRKATYYVFLTGIGKNYFELTLNNKAIKFQYE